MDITTFKNKWLGLRVDADNAYGFQCVDLIKQYLKECYGVNPGSWGNAINYWTNTNPVLLQRFSRIDTSEPQQGDIVVFRTINRNDFSGEGHIGIATGTNSNEQAAVLEQNGSTGGGSGTGKDAIRIRMIDKSRIAGVLRPIVHVVNPPATVVVQPPQGGLVLPTSGEKYDVVVPIGGYITSNQAANHIQQVRTFEPGSYYIYRKANNMININTLPTGPGAWINPNDNVVPIVVPEPVVQRDLVPLVSNVTVQPSANSVVGSSPITATAVVTPVTTTPTETSVMPELEEKPKDWRSTYKPLASGPTKWQYIGETADILDLESESRVWPEKITEGRVITIGGTFVKASIEYARPASCVTKFTWYGIPLADKDDLDNFALAPDVTAKGKETALPLLASIKQLVFNLLAPIGKWIVQNTNKETK